MRRIFPAPDALSSDDDAEVILDDTALDRLYGVARSPHDDRPWVGVCMIASLDGSPAVARR